jgi:hypothetical protein
MDTTAIDTYLQNSFLPPPFSAKQPTEPTAWRGRHAAVSPKACVIANYNTMILKFMQEKNKQNHLF